MRCGLGRTGIQPGDYLFFRGGYRASTNTFLGTSSFGEIEAMEETPDLEFPEQRIAK